MANSGSYMPGDFSREGKYVSRHSKPGKEISMPSRNGGSGAKRVLIIVAIVIAVIIVALIAIEAGFNAGRVHRGVTVEGVAVGGMNQEEAQAAIENKLSERLAATTVATVPTADAFSRALAVAQVDDPALTPETFSPQWDVSAADLGATIDAASLAQDAYDVGRFTPDNGLFANLGKFFSERADAWFGGDDISASVDFDDNLLSSFCAGTESYIGIDMVNGNIAVSDGVASVVPGAAGEKVDTAALKPLLSSAFLGDTSGNVTLPMHTVPVDIDDTEALAVADTVNYALSEPVNFSYEDRSWTADSSEMGSWIVTTVSGEGDSAVLTPTVDPTLAAEGMGNIMGSVAHGTAVNASFDVSSGAPVVVPGIVGTGPDLNQGAAELQNILFGGAGSRSFTLAYGESIPDITTEEAQNMGITDQLSTYSLGYAEGRYSHDHNVELAVNMLNGMLIAPGQTWTWVEDMGPCDSADGFLGDGAIGSGGQIVTEVGGGICNVATGLFNAIYEAGLEIDERHNHSMYMTKYPLGRDCTVSYPGVTFTWTNDYSHYVLLTTSTDGSTMYITVWGASEGRSVDSQTSGLSNLRVTNWRTVTAPDGSIIHEDEFYSYFNNGTL